MKIPAFVWFALSICCVSSLSLRVSAQPAPEAAAVAVVKSVKFAAARQNSDTWLEAAVEVDVRPGGKAAPGEFVDRVKVTLSFGIEATDSKGKKALTYYRASAEAITLEGGEAVYRFYLPPEVVKRDRLRPDVKYYLVEIEAAGALQKPEKAAAGDFASASSLTGFQGKVSSEAGANDGILMPQYLTPFTFDNQRRTITFLRREPQR